MDYLTPYLDVSYRIITGISLLLIISLLMGKRYIGELSIFDFSFALTLGAVIGADLAEPRVPHHLTLFTTVALGLVHYLISRFIIKNRQVGKWLTLDPTVVIQNGVILKDNLSKVRYTVDELLSHLREKDVFDLQEVEFAVLEPSGTLSVLKKSQYQPATAQDLDLTTAYEGLSIPLILEGKIYSPGLQAAQLSEEWLKDKLKGMGYGKPEEIFLTLLNTQGELYISPETPPALVQRLEQ